MEEEIYQKLLSIIERVSQERDTSDDGILNNTFFYFEFNPNPKDKS